MLRCLGGRDDEFFGPVQMASTQRMLANFQAIENLALHGGTQSLDPLQPVLACSGFERGQSGNAQFPVIDGDFLGLRPGIDSMSSTPSGTFLGSFPRSGCVPVRCSFVTISAI